MEVTMGDGGTRAGDRPRTVDIHCHVSNPACEALVREQFQARFEPFVFYGGEESNAYNREHFGEIVPKLTDPELRLRDMDRMGIDVQAISVAPPQYFYWTDPGLGTRLARMINDRLAEIVDAYPTRFVGLGTLPMQDVDRALDELRYIEDLGFAGIEICTNVNGLDFDHPRFRPFFAACQERELLVLVHPNGFTDGERLMDYYLINVMGMPLDSAVFLSRLVFGGVLERFPDLKMCVVHGGGYIPSYPARLDHAYEVRPECRKHISRPPSTYLAQLYYDTVLYEPVGLGHLVERWGSDHVLLGTDYPYDMGESDPVGLIQSVPSLSKEDRARILGGNAARLLRLDG
ncbi:MAG: amidohydrolase family protein [Acidimicrobiia bacterium]